LQFERTFYGQLADAYAMRTLSVARNANNAFT